MEKQLSATKYYYDEQGRYVCEVVLNPQFEQTAKSQKRIIIHQGGSSSGKTWSILQYLIQQARNENKLIEICRVALPPLKRSVLRDFLHICEMLKIKPRENKTELLYEFEKGAIHFFSADDEQKVRGARRDILYMNEANEFTLSKFRALEMRTHDRVIMDFNPSDPIHWIYDEVMPREDCEVFVSTHRDNRFLSEAERSSIEIYKERDPDYYKVFGLGERATFSKGLVYPNWELVAAMPEGDRFYGLDWGFTNDPTALIECTRKGDDIYVREILYSKGLTNAALNAEMIDAGIDKRAYIYADSEDPKSIAELRLYGWNFIPAVKGPDSVRAGINKLKDFNVKIVSGSKNIRIEQLNYKWELDANENPTNKPIDQFNHALDAIRYAVFTKYLKPQPGYAGI
jgi:phage terminase large subunit